MAFNSLVDDARKMNAKMIAMGQSIDIQKMPRPKQGTQMAQKQVMYTPSGSDVEKMLYPKNFKQRAYEPETKFTEQKTKEINTTLEMVEEVIEEQKTLPKIIGDEEIQTPTPNETQITEKEDEPMQKPFPRNSWESCKHYKSQGDRTFCREYLGWCAKDKCARPKY